MVSEIKNIRVWGVTYKIKQEIFPHNSRHIAKMLQLIRMILIATIYILSEGIILGFNTKQLSTVNDVVMYAILAIIFSFILLWILGSYLVAIVQEYKWNFNTQITSPPREEVNTEWKTK